MKRVFTFTAFFLFIAVSKSQGAVVTSGDPFTGGIGYRWTINGMAASENVTLERHVGALSFKDPVNFTDPNGYFGWTHTSDWVQLELTELSNLTISLSRKAGVPNGTATAGDQLFPAFAVWQGTDNDDGDSHVFNNSGNSNWAEDLSFIGNMPNETVDLFAVTKSFALSPGNYSIVLSGNPPQLIGSGRHGYEVTFSTSPVPEPTGAVLMALSVPLLLLRRLRTQKG